MSGNISKELSEAKTAFSNGEGQTFEELDIEEQDLTVAKLRYMLPKDSKVNVSQSTVDMVNKLIDESGVHKGLMEERLMTYTHLLGPGVGMKQLLKAIQFVTLSTTPGMTQTKAYMVTFPDKATQLLDRNADPSSHASMYAKTKIVQEIMENTQVGLSTTYAPLQHQLIEKLLQLSNGNAAGGDRASATVQLNATLGLMELIKTPEDQTINIKTGESEESVAATQNLADQVKDMAAIMRARHKDGESLTNVQRIGIVVDAEVEDDE